MAGPTISQCVASIAQASGLSRDEARELLDRIDARAQRLQREQGLSTWDSVLQAAKDADRDERAAAAIQKHNQLLNLQKRIGRRATMEADATRIGTAERPNLAKAVESQVIAIATPINGGRYSAEAMWKTRAKQYAGELVVRLKQAGLLSAFRDGSLGDAWARELYERSLQSAGDARANPGVTGNSAAETIAGILHDMQEKARGRLNREGAWIGNYAGYITRTNHDPDKIMKAGFKAWRDVILPALDERTFDGVEDREKFLTGLHNALTTGIHLSDEGGIGMKDPAFTGPRNLAKQASAERVLHFKDADGWLGYQKQFGTGSLVEQMLASFDRAARQEALLQRWGTNPRAEFDADIRYMSERFRDTHPAAVNALTNRTTGISNEFGRLDGSLNRPANRLGAQIAADTRTIESMAKLGLVAFTHLSVATTKAAELRYQGIGFFERWGNFFDSLFQGRGRGDMAELADLLLAGTEGMHGRLLARFSPDDTVPGTLSKLANRFFDMTGLTWMLDSQKAGAERIKSRQLGRLIGSDFDHLPPEVARSLTQYAISPADWDTLRNAPDHFASDGRAFLTPDAAMRARLPGELQEGFARFYHGGAEYKGGPRWLTPDISYARGYASKSTAGRVYYVDVPKSSPLLHKSFDDSGTGTEAPYVHFDAPESIAKDLRQIEGHGSMSAEAADRLALRLHALFADVANRSVVTPGIAERTMILGSTRPGTLDGEALRFVSQFKLWGLAAFRQGFGREIYGGQGTAGAISGIMQMTIGAALMGYITMTLKDIAKGIVPRAPNDPKTWVAAMMQGGGYGIMGDYLFGEYNRFGGDIGTAVLGPVLGEGVSELMTIWNDAKAAAMDPDKRTARDIPPELARIVTNNTPFVNLFYTRSALNYLFLHSLQETLNPGYLHRSEMALRRRTGQTHWLSPESHLHTFGR